MENSNPLISILMPLYNGEKYVEQAIRSVQQQIYSNWELIIVNDGSNDASLTIVKKYSDFDKRIHVENQVNEGPANTKNKLIQLFQGDYAVFLDSDDLIDKDMLKVLVNKINAEKNDFILYSFYKFSENEKRIVVRHESSLDIDLMYTAVWNKLYSKRILKKLVFPENTVYEDVAFSAMAIMIAKNPGIIPVNKLLYAYRENATSITNNVNQDVRRHLDIIKDFKKLIDFIEDEDVELTTEQILQVERLINTIVFSHCLQVAELPVLRKEKTFVISNLIRFQKQTVKDTMIYSKSWILNVKQNIFMILIKNRLYGMANVLDMFIMKLK